MHTTDTQRRLLARIIFASLLSLLLASPLWAAEERELTADQREQLQKAQELHAAGLALFKERKYREAKEKYAEALRIRQETLGKDDLATASSHAFLGQLFRTTGDYAEAEEHYQQALVIQERRRGPESPETATALSNLAVVNALRGNDLKAKERHERALAIREKQVGPAASLSTAISLNNLASVCRSLGDYAQAEKLLQRALEIRVKADGPNHAGAVPVLNNLAVLQMWWGKYDHAKRYNERSLRILRQVVDQETNETLATCRLNQGLLATMTGDYATAETSYQEALAIFTKLLSGEHPYTAAVQSALGLLHAAQGDFAKAKTELTESLKVTEARLGKNHRDAVRIRANLGMVEKGLGNAEGAESLLKECLDSRTKLLGGDHSETAASHLNLGQLYQDEGKLELAQLHYESALAIQRRVLGDKHCETAASLNKLGLLELALGRHARAEELIGESLAIRRGLLDVTAHVQTQRQQLQMNQGVRGTLDDWLSLTELDSAAAYAQVLRWKGTVFVRQAALRESRRQPSEEVGQIALELRDVSCRLARFALTLPEDGQQQAYQTELKKLGEARDQLETQLAEKSPSRRQAIEWANLTPSALRKAIPAKTALVDFLEYERFLPPPAGESAKARRERRFVAFVVRPDREEIVRLELGPAATIDSLVDRWHRESKRTANSPLTEPALELRRLLWLPLEPHLEGIEAVLLSPDGALGRLPFAALPGKAPESYLLEEIAVAVLPVPQTLLEGSRPKPPRAAFDMLVLGGINYDATAAPATPMGSDAEPSYDRAGIGLREWQSLPGTRDEGAAIQNMFQRARPKGSVKFLQDDGPTEGLVKELAPQYRYLHFATHGFFAPAELKSALDHRHAANARGGAGGGDQGQFLGYPAELLAGLVLAGANQPGSREDGILTALEVDGLDLSKVQLVMLSACETGLGRAAGGEGLLGLQRSFQLAGARSVVGTLWKVDDSKSRDLMGLFYENYWKNDRSTSECLRQAQLTLLNDPRDRGLLRKEPFKVKSPRLAPYYWAAFVLSGDWR